MILVENQKFVKIRKKMIHKNWKNKIICNNKK